MEKKPKGKMTIERLAKMTADEFAHVNRRFDLVDGRLNEVLAAVKTAKSDLLAAVNAIRDEKIEALERDVAALKKKVGIA